MLELLIVFTITFLVIQAKRPSTAPAVAVGLSLAAGFAASFILAALAVTMGGI